MRLQTHGLMGVPWGIADNDDCDLLSPATRPRQIHASAAIRTGVRLKAGVFEIGSTSLLTSTFASG